MPWARGPFELIVHGEIHFRAGGDFDRRVALISFDNAIEVAIVTYLSLNPIQRNGRTYEKKSVDVWSHNYHTKLDFLAYECNCRGIAQRFGKEVIVWYHDLRNDQYHRGSPSTPNLADLQDLRNVALWIFTTLYEIDDVESELEEQLDLMSGVIDQPEQRQDYDDAIDSFYGDVELAGGVYRASELLFRADPEAYRERALELLDTEPNQLRIVS